MCIFHFLYLSSRWKISSLQTNAFKHLNMLTKNRVRSMPTVHSLHV